MGNFFRGHDKKSAVIIAATCILLIFYIIIKVKGSVFSNQYKYGKRGIAISEIKALSVFVDDYQNEKRVYPNNLDDIVVFASAKKRMDKRASDVVDPWEHLYIYKYPGIHNPKSYDIYSLGPDGKDGTDDDIGNWNLDKWEKLLKENR